MAKSSDVEHTASSSSTTIDWSALRQGRNKYSAQNVISVADLYLMYVEHFQKSGHSDLADICRGMAREMILAVLAMDGDVASLHAAVDSAYGDGH